MDNAKIESALEHAAAEFINRESNRRSLITVTRVTMDDKGLRAQIFVSVFPDTQAAAALDFLSRMEDDFRNYVRKHIKIHVLPRFTFVQDPNIGGLEVGGDQTIA